MEDKRKSIRFIGSDYKTLFTVKDGEQIKFTNGYDGETQNLKCRFIDETHITLSGKHRNDYHICQLAESLERNGSKCEPIPEQKPKLNILTAKYGETLQDVEIPMTEAAVKKLVGEKYDVTELRSGYLLLQGKDATAVCKSEDGVLASVHPYWAQTLKHELGIMKPLKELSTAKKPSMLGELEEAKGITTERNAIAANGDRKPKHSLPEIE
ncbi:hypothetical protein FACS1894111_13410 [Clostridia bacterium]|nr:hypothetical protein FACS1894111_13410 [Clostridia bacterium]